MPSFKELYAAKQQQALDKDRALFVKAIQTTEAKSVRIPVKDLACLKGTLYQEMRDAGFQVTFPEDEADLLISW